MPQFTISIKDEDEIEHYKRIVTDGDLNFVITQLDKSLNVKPRRRRRDAGVPRTTQPQQP